MDNKKQLMAMVLCGMASLAQAGEKEELLKLRNTTTNLIKELVKQHVLTEQAAAEMIKRAEADAEAQVAKQASQPGQKDVPPEAGEVRVPYVPDFVKDDIRKQVRSELRADVVKDVMQEAKTQKWGIPDALPDWVNRFHLSGDLRLRDQNEFMDPNNAAFGTAYLNYQNINQSGSLNNAGLNAYINTQHNRQRFRERLRVVISADVADGLTANVRMATASAINNGSNVWYDPTSTNQTLGNYSAQYQFLIDRAYLQYEAKNGTGFKWLTLTGGRIPNPWFVGGNSFTGGSELVWDTDLNFEGFAATVRHAIGNDKQSLFATAGAFPLQEAALSTNNKWLFGSQVGVDWGFANDNKLKVGAAFYDYENVRAQPNTNATATCNTNSANNAFSVPQFMAFGNTASLICYDNNNTSLPGQYGLASDYRIFNATADYDINISGPHHLMLSADFAKNVGFNLNSVRQLAAQPAGVSDQTTAWQVRMDFGFPKVTRANQWSVFTLYKYVEADSVFSAFTDSDFHLGGTNAKGWVVGANYGLMKNVWAQGRWLSTDVISGPKYSNDVLQLDLNTRF